MVAMCCVVCGRVLFIVCCVSIVGRGNLFFVGCLLCDVRCLLCVAFCLLLLANAV